MTTTTSETLLDTTTVAANAPLDESTAPATTCIYLEPTRVSRIGPLYRVRLDSPDGRIIVQGSIDPEHAACRALVKMGIVGRLEVWAPGRSTPRMIIHDIERTAGMRASEDANEAPRTRPFHGPAFNDNSADERAANAS